MTLCHKKHVLASFLPNTRASRKETLLYDHNLFACIWFPLCWKYGYITPVPKDLANVCSENLRLITHTNVCSKIMEEFRFHKIYNQVISKVNPNQHGAVKQSL